MRHTIPSETIQLARGHIIHTINYIPTNLGTLAPVTTLAGKDATNILLKHPASASLTNFIRELQTAKFRNGFATREIIVYGTNPHHLSVIGIYDTKEQKLETNFLLHNISLPSCIDQTSIRIVSTGDFQKALFKEEPFYSNFGEAFDTAAFVASTNHGVYHPICFGTRPRTFIVPYVTNEWISLDDRSKVDIDWESFSHPSNTQIGYTPTKESLSTRIKGMFEQNAKNLRDKDLYNNTVPITCFEIGWRETGRPATLTKITPQKIIFFENEKFDFAYQKIEK